MKRAPAFHFSKSFPEELCLDTLVASVPDMVWAKDTSGVFLMCNPVVEQFFGASKNEIVGRTGYDFVNLDVADYFREGDLIAMAGELAQVNEEWLIFACDSRPRLFETMKAPMRDVQGNILGLLGIARDITTHHESKAARESLNRALKLLGRCNHAMMYAADENSLLSDICQLAMDVGWYLMAWVGFPDTNELKSVTAAACSNSGSEYLKRIRVSWADDAWGRGPCGTAIRRAKTVINQNYGSNASMQPWRAIAEEFGFRSSIAIPIIRDGSSFGVLSIYAAEPDAFGPEETGLLEELAADLAFGIRTLRTKAERDVAERKLEFLAHHDTLTSTPNRLFLRRRFAECLMKGGAASPLTALLLMDVDNFKAINDSLGHDIGDALLVEVSRRLQDTVRNAGVLCRYGGDEFAVLLSRAGDAEEITHFVRGLIALFTAPIAVGEYHIDVTFSIGVSFYPDNGDKLDDLIRYAGTALQKAKDSGKNTYCFFDVGMTTDAHEQVLLCAQLRNAIRNDQLVLHYQPKIDLKSGAIVGAEALVRWQHPERGLLGPGEFVPLAETTGLIVPIGEWVLSRACQQVAVWRELGLPLDSVSVNVSAVQVRRGNLLQSVITALRNARIDGQYIDLELTESAFLDDMDGAGSLIRDLRGLGVKLSIDDFGTGYSSLAYLKTLRVDRLKIDRLFIQDILDSAETMAIVKTIVQLGRNLDLAITAEGVESVEQLDALKALGCDEVQGFLFSKPVDASAFMRLCASFPATFQHTFGR